MNGAKPSHNERSSPPRADHDKIVGYPASRNLAGELTPIAESTKDLVTATAPVAEEHKEEAGVALSRQKMPPRRRQKNRKKDNKLQL